MNDTITEHGYLYKKIDAIEHRLETHVSKIEQRLDQLVHILNTVASLQEREVRNAESIKELKQNIKETLEKGEKVVSKLHDRIDEINKSIDIDADHQIKIIQTVEEHINKVNDEVVKWRERGVGLWVGITALIFCIQIMGGYILKSFDDNYKATNAQVLNISNRQLDLEQELLKIKKSNPNLKE